VSDIYFYDFLGQKKRASLGGGIFLFFREKESSRQQLEKLDRFSYFATWRSTFIYELWITDMIFRADGRNRKG